MKHSESPTSSSSNRVADRALRDHFANELAGVQGRSRAAFLAAIAQEPVEKSAPSGGRRLMIGTLFAAAAAAAFGFGIWSAGTVDRDPVPEVASNSPGEASGEPETPFRTLAYDPADLRPVTPVAREQYWESRDAGTYVIDGAPVRAVQRREWEKTSFRNAAGYEVTIERPREQWMLVDADVQ